MPTAMPPRHIAATDDTARQGRQQLPPSGWPMVRQRTKNVRTPTATPGNSAATLFTKTNTSLSWTKMPPMLPMRLLGLLNGPRTMAASTAGVLFGSSWQPSGLLGSQSS
jgi:hypothetical protein